MFGAENRLDLYFHLFRYYFLGFRDITLGALEKKSATYLTTFINYLSIIDYAI